MNKLVAVVGLLLCASTAGAATQCRLVATPGVAFGSYDTLSNTPVDSLTNITVACDRHGGPPTVRVTLSLGQGTHGSSVHDRRMRKNGNGSDYLAYGLYRDVSRTAVWGDSPGVDTMTETITVPNRGTASTSFTVYGRIPALQNVSAGTYGDSIVITVTP